MDNVTGLFIMNGVCLIPALLNIFSSHRGLNRTMKMLTWLTDIAAVLMQLCVCLIPYLLETQEKFSTELRWQLPLSLFLISLGYWESFAEIRVPQQSSFQWFYHGMRLMKKTRPKIYVTASLLKIIVLITTAVHLLPKSIDRRMYLDLFKQIPIGFNDMNDRRVTGMGVFDQHDDLFRITSEVYVPMIVHIVSSCICYYTGRIACKVRRVSSRCLASHPERSI